MMREQEDSHRSHRAADTESFDAVEAVDQEADFDSEERS